MTPAQARQIEREVEAFRKDVKAQEDLKKKLYGGKFLKQRGTEEIEQEILPLDAIFPSK